MLDVYVNVRDCPSNSGQTPGKLWDRGDAMTTGYVWFNERTGAAAAGMPLLAPPLAYQKKMTANHGASELAADVIVSDTAGPWANFTYVPGGAMPFGSSHLAGKVPEGQNVLMTDGSVAERKFPKDLTQATAIAQGGAFVWVVNP